MYDYLTPDMVERRLAPTSAEQVTLLTPVSLATTDRMGLFEGKTCSAVFTGHGQANIQTAWDSSHVASTRRSSSTNDQLGQLDSTLAAGAVASNTQMRPIFDLSGVGAQSMRQEFVLCILSNNGDWRLVDTGIVIFMTSGCSLVGSSSDFYATGNADYTIYDVSSRLHYTHRSVLA